jgi:hypothetical protein
MSTSHATEEQNARTFEERCRLRWKQHVEEELERERRGERW